MTQYLKGEKLNLPYLFSYTPPTTPRQQPTPNHHTRAGNLLSTTNPLKHTESPPPHNIYPLVVLDEFILSPYGLKSNILPMRFYTLASLTNQ